MYLGGGGVQVRIVERGVFKTVLEQRAQTAGGLIWGITQFLFLRNVFIFRLIDNT